MEDACADGRLTLIGFLFSPASAARPPRGFGGGGIAGAPPPRWRGGHTWLDHLPASVAFCDVDTTGVSQHDRTVSFGGIGMIGRNLAPSGQALSVLCQPWLGAWRSQGGCKLALSCRCGGPRAAGGRSARSAIVAARAVARGTLRQLERCHLDARSRAHRAGRS